MTTKEESTGASQLDPGLRDQKDVSQAVGSSWLNVGAIMVIMMGSVIFLLLMAFLMSLGGVRFVEALGISASVYGPFVLLGIIGIVIEEAIASFKRRNPEFIEWLKDGEGA